MFDAINEMQKIAASLQEAAKSYQGRTDNFAFGKAKTCQDIACNIVRYGEFKSDAQRDFAMKLIEWAKPRVETQVVPDTTKLPNLVSLLRKFAHLYYGNLKISKKNGAGLWWVMANTMLVGRIEADATLSLWSSKLRAASATREAVVAKLETLEKDPLEAMKADGKLTGRCCCCGRELTDPVSIENGIGPICEAKAGGF